MFGKYTSAALRDISSNRTDRAVELIENCQGDVKAMYAMFGDTDLLLVVDFPGVEQAMKASVNLNKLTNISFTSSPAMPVAQFDKLME